MLFRTFYFARKHFFITFGLENIELQLYFEIFAYCCENHVDVAMSRSGRKTPYNGSAKATPKVSYEQRVLTTTMISNPPNTRDI